MLWVSGIPLYQDKTVKSLEVFGCDEGMFHSLYQDKTVTLLEVFGCDNGLLYSLYQD